MLITLFLSIAAGIMNAFLSIFPTADTSTLSNITTSVSTASSYLSAIDNFVPVSVLVGMISTFLAVEGFILLVKAINWIIRKIPSIN